MVHVIIIWIKGKIKLVFFLQDFKSLSSIGIESMTINYNIRISIETINFN